MTNQLQWKIDSLDAHYSNAALELICNEFCTNSTLHRAVGLKRPEFRQSMSQGWENTIKRSPVTPLVAIDTNTDRVIGCMIPEHFPADFSGIDKLPSKRRSIALLLQALEEKYFRTHPNNETNDRLILIDLAVVSRAHSGLGIYQELRQTMHVNAKEAGYQSIVGELSSAATQRVCVEKFGHRVMAEIDFKSYSEGPRQPFISIAEPPTIQLVVGEL